MRVCVRRRELGFARDSESEEILRCCLEGGEFDRDSLCGYVMGRRCLGGPGRMVSLAKGRERLDMNEVFTVRPNVFERIRVVTRGVVTRGVLRFFPRDLAECKSLRLRGVLRLGTNVDGGTGHYGSGCGGCVDGYSVVASLDGFGRTFECRASYVYDSILSRLRNMRSLFS